jgi:hypothetical protein
MRTRDPVTLAHNNGFWGAFGEPVQGVSGNGGEAA